MEKKDTPRVLVVDDELDLLELFERRLTRAGFQVSTVSSGEQAVARLASETFDIVVCDIHMPQGLDGCEVFKHVKNSGAHKPHFVFISGYGDETPEHQKARALNPAYIFSKPVSSKHFVETLRELATR